MSNRQSIAIIGCGYVGSALAKALVDAGHDVVATTTTRERVDALCALGTRGELLDVADVDRLAAVVADREVVYLTIAPKRRVFSGLSIPHPRGSTVRMTGAGWMNHHRRSRGTRGDECCSRPRTSC